MLCWSLTKKIKCSTPITKKRNTCCPSIQPKMRLTLPIYTNVSSNLFEFYFYFLILFIYFIYFYFILLLLLFFFLLTLLFLLLFFFLLILFIYFILFYWFYFYFIDFIFVLFSWFYLFIYFIFLLYFIYLNLIVHLIFIFICVKLVIPKSSSNLMIPPHAKGVVIGLFKVISHFFYILLKLGISWFFFSWNFRFKFSVRWLRRSNFIFWRNYAR